MKARGRMQPGVREGRPGECLRREDPALAAELDALLAGLGPVPEPKPRARLAPTLRARILNRRRYRDPLRDLGFAEALLVAAARSRGLLRRSRSFRVLAAGALAAALGLAAADSVRPVGGTPAGVASRMARRVVPAAEGPAARRPRISSDGAALRHAWLGAENDLRRLRRLLDPGGLGIRSRLARLGAADGRTRRRIAALSAAVAGGLAAPAVPLEDRALALRALLLAGSTVRRGPYHQLVRRTLDELELRLPALSGEPRIHVLAAYLEGALVTGGRRLRVLRREMRRFVREEGAALAALQAAQRRLGTRRSRAEALYAFRRPDVQMRPALASWSTSVEALADAGLLLRLAPALGADPGAAAALRRALLRHLEERAQRAGRRGAFARAAILHGFADLVAREPLLRALALESRDPAWFAVNPRMVQFLAWTLFANGSGWARFEHALRALIAGAQPKTLHDRASYLLAQMVYLAPVLD